MEPRPKSSQGVVGGGRNSPAPLRVAPRPRTAMGLSREQIVPHHKVRACTLCHTCAWPTFAATWSLCVLRHEPFGVKEHDTGAEILNRRSSQRTITPLAPAQSAEASGSGGAPARRAGARGAKEPTYTQVRWAVSPKAAGWSIRLVVLGYSRSP
jgi:hypothetical protein